MGFKCGIVGLPNVGKSTIFNALTAVGAAAENYPFCTIDPNIGRVDVPDPRLQELDTIVHAQRIVPASMEFVDIAGLVKGAAKGEGLGNQFLGHIRSTDAVAHVVRCFADPNVTHVDGSVNPERDISTIEAELIFADEATASVALERYRKLSKVPDKKLPPTIKMLEALQSHLQKLQPARTFKVDDYIGDVKEVGEAFRDLHLITSKKVVYVCNVDEDMAAGDTDNEYTLIVKKHAEREGAGVVIICGKLEAELSQLDPESKAAMIADLGMHEPGLNRLIRAGYVILGLQTYFTAGVKEIRAWTIHRGDKAPAAAGKIHSDFERGFISAEVCTVKDLIKAGSRVKLKEVGLMRMEGREYVVQDGDVMEFRFNV